MLYKPSFIECITRRIVFDWRFPFEHYDNGYQGHCSIGDYELRCDHNGSIIYEAIPPLEKTVKYWIEIGKNHPHNKKPRTYNGNITDYFYCKTR